MNREHSRCCIKQRDNDAIAIAALTPTHEQSSSNDDDAAAMHEGLIKQTQANRRAARNRSSAAGGERQAAGDSNEGPTGIERAELLLAHACSCPPCTCHCRCTRADCDKMKRVIEHVRLCRLRHSGQCTLCKRFIRICCYHAHDCVDDSCPVRSAIRAAVLNHTPNSAADTVLPQHPRKARGAAPGRTVIRRAGVPVTAGALRVGGCSMHFRSIHLSSFNSYARHYRL